MCGLVGVAWPRDRRVDWDSGAVLERMADAIIHRGPNDFGCWVDPTGGFGAAFRRLSILDLSPEGHQPMLSATGRFVIVFNGEIYNFVSLRSELENLGHQFRGHSDTEIMLAAIEQWGIRQLPQRLMGMFAIAVWDRTERKLYLIRDRLGKKPLYYGWHDNCFFFGSELKAMRNHPAFRADIDREALALYMRFNCVPGSHSIYINTHKLTPGCMLEIDPDRPGWTPALSCFWDPFAMAQAGQADPFRGSSEEASEALESLLSEAVATRMVADVPVGAFLSGGIDSSLVVALMQRQSPVPVRTFTIGYDNKIYNEAGHAAAVARHLGTQHMEWLVTPQDAMDIIPSLPRIFDEPFADSSQIPTFLVSRLARREVTVALSGDGGDEVFGGYNRYHIGSGIFRRTRKLPPSLRLMLAAGIRAVQPASWDKFAEVVECILPARYRNLVGGERLHKLAGVLKAREWQDFYQTLVSHWHDGGQLVLGLPADAGRSFNDGAWQNFNEPAHAMMLSDLVSYLQDDILVKVDRASMANSLECRAPFLDHRAVEFAWSLPLSMKIRDGKGKWILRNILSKYVPDALIERPKTGFGVPIGDWLRGPLRDWAETLLAVPRLQSDGYLDPIPIQEKWKAHLSGSANWQYDLWDVLMFQSWLDESKP